MTLTLDDFDYDLPAQLIAQRPLTPRAASRMLVTGHESLEDRYFRELATFLHPGDLLVFNDTRVIHARLRGAKPSGGKVEVLVERLIGTHEVLAQVRASHKPQAGTRLLLDGGIQAEVLARAGEFFHLCFAGAEDALTLLERHGRLPLPPYIEREAAEEDESSYQTIFARAPGSVAAPTAGLHFDETILESLRQRNIGMAFLTLHVGAGTFQPVRVRQLSEHRMHRERFVLPAGTVDAIRQTRLRGGKVVAVGTTSLRALEASAQDGEIVAGMGETDLFILPGFRFQVADRLITNFHLPKSTLLMLVSAFAGVERIRRAYRYAVEHRYRFFSYGDAMLVSRAE